MYCYSICYYKILNLKFNLVKNNLYCTLQETKVANVFKCALFDKVEKFV